MADLTPFSRRSFNALLLASGASAVIPGANAQPAPRASEAANRAPGKFSHPGMLQSAADLRRMREAVRDRRQPIFSGFEKMRDDPHSQLSYQPAGASEEVGRNPTVRSGMFDSDANAAYQCAIMGHITEDPAYFRLCARILDDWASTLKRVTGADAVLCAGLGGFKFANAAELLRSSSFDWPQASAQRFGSMMREVILPVLNNFAPFANGNWDTAAIKTMMAIAIYTDDPDLFERALLYYNHGCGDGRLSNYIYPNGQCQESGRDQQHTQLGITHMGDCCEVAWHQGLDLYGMLDNRLLLGFEYTARYILGEDVPFTPDEDRTGKYKHTVIAPRSALRNNFEQIYNHYAKRRGLPAPWTQKAAEKVRPEGPGFQADATGFGTLLYSRDPGPDTAEAAAVAKVRGIYASPAPQGLAVQWIPLAASTSYAVVRTDRSVTASRLPAKRGADELRDTTAQPGRTYTYRVSAAAARAMSSSIPAVAGLPAGWLTATIGTAPLQGSAFYDGAAWRIEAFGGLAPSGPGGSAFCVHSALARDGCISARLSPLFASQALHAGIAFFRGPALAPCAMVLLEPNTRATTEHVGWVIRSYICAANGDTAVAAGEHLVEPTVRYGRVYVPLSLRLQQKGDATQSSYSLDGETWTALAAAPGAAGPLHAGLLLNSGLDGIPTEVVFDHVVVQAAPGAESLHTPPRSHGQMIAPEIA